MERVQLGTTYKTWGLGGINKNIINIYMLSQVVHILEK